MNSEEKPRAWAKAIGGVNKSLRSGPGVKKIMGLSDGDFQISNFSRRLLDIGAFFFEPFQVVFDRGSHPRERLLNGWARRYTTRQIRAIG